MDIHYYIAIDLKSFYASIECVERKLNPLTTNLVVADEERTEKTICLAVSPTLKAYGIPGRARLFEVLQCVEKVNRERSLALHGKDFAESSADAERLRQEPDLKLDFIIAKPRMATYVEYSTKIYEVYLKYVAPEDIHVYSIDEVFIDVTHYLKVYHATPHELAERMIQDVYATTGITATAGIGTNLYLCKVAMDIVAKHAEADEKGVRIAELDEKSYRRLLWSHRPLTDFWRVGRGYAKKLEKVGIYTMGDVARCSIGKPGEYYNEELLYKMFGVSAELLIDHAWGYEPCTIEQIKAYKPETNSLSSGQVLHCPYDCEKAKLIVREMTDLLVLDLVEKHLVTNQMVLTIGYDIENLSNPEIRKQYHGEVTTDHYGRKIPKHAHGTINLEQYVSSTRIIMDAVMNLYERIVNPNLLIRRINVAANHLAGEQSEAANEVYTQMELFAEEKETVNLSKERKLQEAMINVKNRYGKNAILKGTNLEEGATSIQRNQQIGGHNA